MTVAVGAAVGTGVPVGAAVGTGVPVGAAVGTGVPVGASVGGAVGASVGGTVGCSVGGAVGGAVGGIVGQPTETRRPLVRELKSESFVKLPPPMPVITASTQLSAPVLPKRVTKFESGLPT